MVCVPCFIIPLLLYIWHKFVQPIMLRYWNPWAKKDAQGNVIKAPPAEFPFECKGGVCPFPAKNKKHLEGDGETTARVPSRIGSTGLRQPADEILTKTPPPKSEEQKSETLSTATPPIAADGSKKEK